MTEHSLLSSRCLILVLGTFSIYFSSATGLADKVLYGDYTPVIAKNTPIGTGIGIHPGRVVWEHNPDATSWDGENSKWWQAMDQDTIDDMFDNATTLFQMLLQTPAVFVGQYS